MAKLTNSSAQDSASAANIDLRRYLKIFVGNFHLMRWLSTAEVWTAESNDCKIACSSRKQNCQSGADGCRIDE